MYNYLSWIIFEMINFNIYYWFLRLWINYLPHPLLSPFLLRDTSGSRRQVIPVSDLAYDTPILGQRPEVQALKARLTRACSPLLAF